MTHTFSVKNVTAYRPSQKGEPATDASTDGSSITSSIGQPGALAGIVSANTYITKAVLENYKSNAVDSDISALMADL